MSKLKKVISSVYVIAIAIATLWTVHSYREMMRPGKKWENSGIDALERHDVKAAKDDWLLGTKLDPTYVANYQRLGDLGLALKDMPGAGHFLSQAVAISPQSIDTDIKASKVNMALNNYPMAQKDAQAAIDHGGDSAAAEELLGEAAAKQNISLVALRAMKQAYLMSPQTSDYLLGYVSVLIDSEKTDEAQRLLQTYLALHHKDEYANFMLSVILEKKPPTTENLNEILAHDMVALSHNDKKIEYWNLLGETYLRLGQMKPANMAYGHAYLLNKTSESALQGLVASFNALRDKPHADEAASRLNSVIALHEKIDQFQFIMQQNPHNVGVGVQLAKLKESDNKVKTAEEMYTTLVQDNPTDKRARTAAEDFFIRTHRPDQAHLIATYDPKNNH